MVRKSSSYNHYNIYYYYYYYLNMCHKQPDRQITLSMFLLFFGTTRVSQNSAALCFYYSYAHNILFSENNLFWIGIYDTFYVYTWVLL